MHFNVELKLDKILKLRQKTKALEDVVRDINIEIGTILESVRRELDVIREIALNPNKDQLQQKESVYPDKPKKLKRKSPQMKPGFVHWQTRRKLEAQKAKELEHQNLTKLENKE